MISSEIEPNGTQSNTIKKSKIRPKYLSYVTATNETTTTNRFISPDLQEKKKPVYQQINSSVSEKTTQE